MNQIFPGINQPTLFALFLTKEVLIQIKVLDLQGPVSQKQINNNIINFFTCCVQLFTHLYIHPISL